MVLCTAPVLQNQAPDADHVPMEVPQPGKKILVNFI